MNTLRGGGLPNVRAKQPGSVNSTAAAGTAGTGDTDVAQRLAASKGSDVGGVKKIKQPLTMQDLLSTLRHSPVHAHSQLHYQLQHMCRAE
jgi:hypothetical protein